MQSDYTYYLNQIKKDKSKQGLKSCPVSMREDPDFILKALPYIHYNTIPSIIADNEKLIKKAYSLDFYNVQFFSNFVRSDIKWAKYFVAQNGFALKYLQAFQNNEEICQMAINNNIASLAYVKNDSLKNNDEYIKRAIWEKPQVFLSLDEDKQKNPLFIEQALFKEPSLYFQLPIKMQKDEFTILQALKYIKPKEQLKKIMANFEEQHFDNKNIVLASIEKIDWFLNHASLRLKQDDEVIQKALARSPMNLEFLLPHYQDNIHIVRLCVENYGISIKFASERLKADKGMVHIALENAPLAMEYISSTLKNDLHFMLPLLEKKSYYYKHLSDELKQDRALFEKHFKLDVSVFSCAYEGFRNEAQYAIEAINKNNALFEHVGKRLKNDLSFMTPFLKKKAMFYQYLSYELKEDIELFEKYFKKDKTIYICSNEKIKNCAKYAHEAIKTNVKFFDYMGSELKKKLGQKKYDNTTLSLLEKIQLESILDVKPITSRKIKI